MELTQQEKISNAYSHRIGFIDSVKRCLDCEIASWNAWKSNCGGNTLDAAYRKG